MLIESISQQIRNPASQTTACFSTLYLKYVCSQLNLDPDTANLGNFNIISGDMKDMHRFRTGFYGITDWPANFKMNYTLKELKKTYCFLDDFLIVSKRSNEIINNMFSTVSKNLLQKTSELIFPNVLSYNWKSTGLKIIFSQLGTSVIENKPTAILYLEAPKTLKKLPYFLVGAVHYISKLIPNLAQISYPLQFY